jgi:hypothetical protein
MTYLSQLWNNASQNPANVIALIAAIAAVAGVIIALMTIVISSFVSVLVARRQIRASLVSSNRQGWINALRDDLAELFEVMDWLHLLRPGTYSGADGYRFVDERRSRIRLLNYRIRLRLNTAEQDNIALLHNIELLEGSSLDDFTAQMDATVKLSQSVLKREWVRVKNGR